MVDYKELKIKHIKEEITRRSTSYQNWQAQSEKGQYETIIQQTLSDPLISKKECLVMGNNQNE